MIKKLLSIAALVAVCCTMSAQSMRFSKCPTKLQANSGLMAKAPQKAVGKCEFSYVDVNSLDDLSAVGVEAKSTYDVCIYVPGTYEGKKITDISFWLNGITVLTDVGAWISTDVDNMAASSTADGGYWAIGSPVKGKNVATVDNGFTVPAAGCYVGYTLTTTSAGTQAGKYPICVAGNDIEGGMIMRFTGGSDYSFASYTGNGFGCLTVAVTLDGEFPDNMVSVAPSFRTVYAPLGGKGTAKAQIKNLSVDPITSLGYTVTDGAGTVSAEQTYDMSSEPLAALKTATAYFEMDASATVCLDQRTITITKVNGNAVASTENITCKGTLDTKAKMYPRTALIEKFTGQSCGNCPAGEKVIVAAVEGLKDPSRVARIDHHAGYYDDIFTVKESKSIASYFSINYAPCCMLDRTFQEERLGIKGYDGVAWHPGYMTTDMLQNEIDKPSYITVDLDAYIEKDTKNLIVNVKGQGEEYKDSVVNLTVVLCQSGYAASQSGASNYVHNDFPIKFLSATYKGDAITFDADGNYEKTYTLEVADKYNVNVDFTQLSVVAFASKFKNRNNGEVYNAASMKVAEADPAGIDNVEGNVGNGTIIGRYTVDGQKVNAPVKGINILKTSDGRTLKVLVK